MYDHQIPTWLLVSSLNNTKLAKDLREIERVYMVGAGFKVEFPR
jgi:hypothetical protein